VGSSSPKEVSSWWLAYFYREAFLACNFRNSSGAVSRASEMKPESVHGSASSFSSNYNRMPLPKKRLGRLKEKKTTHQNSSRRIDPTLSGHGAVGFLPTAAAAAATPPHSRSSAAAPPPPSSLLLRSSTAAAAPPQVTSSSATVVVDPFHRSTSSSPTNLEVGRGAEELQRMLAELRHLESSARAAGRVMYCWPEEPHGRQPVQADGEIQVHGDGLSYCGHLQSHPGPNHNNWKMLVLHRVVLCAT
jgi:hypothetical protein